ncbi:MAG: DUF106 domain-containing protein [Candidatus Methanomethylophilaceae archaeon]|nr:DUF106 domain-containing protein [Candidatus Methanomethylophilaceae archaeon]
MADAAAPPQAPPMPSMMPMLIMMFLILILYTVDGQDHVIGEILDKGLFFLGMDGKYPVVTLFIAGALMASTSAILRSFFMDMLAQAKSQQIMSAFNKELRQARLENNSFKIKKLTEMQPAMMAKNMENSNKMMKSMPFTMIIIIPMFLWIRYFVNVTVADAGTLGVFVPWANVSLLDQVWFMPDWILIYTLISIPFGQIVNRLIRTYKFRKYLQQLDAGEGAEAA